MSLVQLLERKWYFIYTTGTHARPGTILQGNRIERLKSVSDLYVFK